jgi:hypothetical protein
MSKTCLSMLAVLACACVASERGSDSTVDHARIIAVIATPPESVPSASVHYRAVIAAPDGTPAPTLSWSYCRTPRSAGDNTAASPACATTEERALMSTQLAIDAPVPSDACTIFGSETPSGHTSARADATGGYYQPLRVALAGGEAAVVRQRIACALPNAPLSAARDYAQHYVPNTAPSIQGMRVLADGGELDLGRLPQREVLTIELALSVDARQKYLFYDPQTGGLTIKEEQLSATWFTTDGVFDDAITQVSETTARNQLRRAGMGAVAELWIVVRDDRGGTAVQQQTLRFGGGPP